MTGYCWRLLAVFALLCFSTAAAAPTLLLAQDAAADRAPAPELAPQLAPKFAPNWAPLRYGPLISPVWIPPPNLPRPSSIAPGTNGFRQLVNVAGIIFSGRVTAVGHSTSFPRTAPAPTAVTFYVEHAIRGTRTGQSLTIHEWAGLWTSGERYRIGEQLLLFLYPPGKLGLTSPVGGALGRFPINSQGGIVMSELHAAMLAGDPIAGGKSVVQYADFALAVQRSGEKAGEKK
jgi:hypothetical protein